MTPEQLAAYHATHPGITEDLLVDARDDTGRDPYDWLLEPLPDAPSVLDLACGSAPVADRVGRYVGVDASPAEVAEARRRRPGVDVRVGDALDPSLFEASYDAVVVSMALMLLDVDRLLPLALQAAPLLVAIVPVRGDAARGSRYGELLRVLGTLDVPYPTPLDHLPGELRWFRRPPDPDLVVRSFYAPTATPEQVAAVHALLHDPVDYPIRRLVLRG